MSSSDLVLALNPEQRAAAEHVEGPMLVLAGAGSGKTRVLTTRIALLIERHGVRPEKIFAVTFTNRAAAEMKERIGRMLDRDPTGLWIGTFHSLSARLLRREAERLGFSREFTIYDETDRLALIKRLLEQRSISPKMFPPKLVQNVISSAKNRMQTADDLHASSSDPLTGVAAEIYRGLTTALKNQNAMDFDDLMLHPLALFKNHPDRLAWYQQRFGFVLVDEFQDTNKAQYQLIRDLSTRHRNAFVVGDDDQSIYGWRGAEVRNMRVFQEDFGGCQLVRLEENYRSTQVVLDAANAAIAPNAGRIGKTLRTRRSGGEPVTMLGAADERDEAEWIVRELGTRRASGDFTPSQMAVLYRTNAQSRAMEEAFRRAGMTYRVVGSVSFYERREVKDLLAYLRLLVNPADDEAFLRAVGVPRRGIGDTSLDALRTVAATWQKPLLETSGIADRIAGLRPNVREAFRRFAELINGIKQRVGAEQPAVILEAVIEAISYERVLHDEGPEGKDRWDNVKELVAAAASWSEVVTESDETTPLQRFLTEAALLSAVDKSDGDDLGVTLMTMHTAKGLEWPLVVVAGMEDGLFPLSRAAESVAGLEEERRLFYVALTRAKDKLYLTWARSRRRGGEILPSIASRFLETIPPGIVDEKTTTSLFAPTWGGGNRYGGRTSSSRFGGGAWEKRPAQQPFGPSAKAAEREAVEEVSQDAPRYVKGERVKHRRFGSGLIQGLTGGGKDLKVTVAFDDPEFGTKQLLVAYAGLERDWESA